MNLLRAACRCLTTAALVLAAACHSNSVMVERPHNPAVVDRAISERWAREIQRSARDGDWILTRSYALMADGIVVTTGGDADGTPMSHASIYSAERGTVIEAIGGGVREIPLADLMQRNHYAVVVRPTGMSAAAQQAAVVRARAQVGRPYDVSGIFGLDTPDKFYCSELVWWASDGDARFGAETVITPSEMMQHGEVVYWSGPRDDAQLTAAVTDAVAAR